MPYHIQEGEALLLPPSVDTIFNRCCDCGLCERCFDAMFEEENE